MVNGMYVAVNVMLSLVSVMRPHHALCNLSARMVVKLCILLCVCMLRECEGDGNAGVGDG